MYKLLLIIHTIRHLRPIQILYQLWYRLRRMWRKATGFKYPLSIEKQGTPVKLQPWIEKPVTLKINLEAQSTPPPWGAGGSGCSFKFLNLSKKYDGNINWSETKHGALWSYNLNYMDYLLQPGMDQQTGLQLIENFIQHLPQNPTALEPYPIALRGINWIKFFSKYSLLTTHYSFSLYAQYLILLDNLEYHLLANHLLEDGFSLLFGGLYFSDEKLYNKGKEIIQTELEEQILEDGAHFELSPMYHQIIHDRLLDCINLVQNNQRFNNQNELLQLMEDKAQKMLTWLNTITFTTGEIPLLNDSAPGIAPTTKQLNKYAASLNIELETFSVTPSFSNPPAGGEQKDDGGTNPDSETYRGNLELETCNLQLGASGYRKFTSLSYECIIDIGQIGPSYQPGHAHADTFNFILNVKNELVIVDTGISTYDAGETRLKERGTASHNTITVQDKNSSEVWSSFRVARRAKVNVLKYDENTVIAQHDGYKRMGTIHQREWNFEENQIEITDTLTGKIKEGKAHFWFSPRVNPKKSEQTIETKNATITFENAVSISLVKTEIPKGYNLLSTTTKIEISFSGILKTTIRTTQ
jgi:hypothetical protein